LQAEPPELGKIPEEDIIGVTVLLLTCSYVGQEFIRVGYYVSNEYVDEHLREEPPAKVLINRVQRNILADKPRVTKFPIVFNSPPPPPNPIPDGNEAVRPMDVDADMDIDVT
jgi:histone chaperone ASF1